MSIQYFINIIILAKTTETMIVPYIIGVLAASSWKSKFCKSIEIFRLANCFGSIVEVHHLYLDQFGLISAGAVIEYHIRQHLYAMFMEFIYTIDVFILSTILGSDSSPLIEFTQIK